MNLVFVSHTDSRKGKQKTRFSVELLDVQDPATVLRSDGVVGDLKKALAERMLNAEMGAHLDGGGRSSNKPATIGTARAGRRYSATTANWCCRFPETGTADSIPP